MRHILEYAGGPQKVVGKWALAQAPDSLRAPRKAASNRIRPRTPGVGECMSASHGVIQIFLTNRKPYHEALEPQFKTPTPSDRYGEDLRGDDGEPSHCT